MLLFYIEAGLTFSFNINSFYLELNRFNQITMTKVITEPPLLSFLVL